MKIGEKSAVPHKYRMISSVIAVFYMMTLFPYSAYALEGEGAKRNRALVEAAFTGETESAVISAERGGEVRLGRATIVIPAGALQKDTEISITRLFRVADTGERLYNATEGRGGYRFLPAGQQFEKEVIIRLPYGEELSGKKAALDELKTYFYDTKKGVWTALTRRALLEDEGLIESVSTHFTDMINGTLVLPETAEALDFNINSIKNLEAANPLSGVVRPEGFEASSFGDASFRFTLPLTAGRAGLTPSVAVVYSSGGGNGICGIGFDVQYGSVITTDTRQGLPKYDGNDTYVKDGTILRCIKKGVGVWEYEPKKKTVFEKIERHRNDEDDWWVVYEKNGIKKYYGNSPDSYSCAGGSKRAKFSWYLTKEEDRYGNTIVYTYEKDEEYVYPTEIRYTGHGRERGRYFVSFGYDKKHGENYVRPDVRTDGRGKFLSVCGWRLTEISTNYEHQENGGMTKVVLKRFCFKYAGENDNYDAAWVSLLKRFEVYSGAETHCDYAYEFSYNNLERNRDGTFRYFADGERWYSGGALRASSGTSTGVSASGTGGVGYGFRWVDGRFTGGGQGSSTSSDSWTDEMLCDMNGDGRPDIVYKKKNLLTGRERVYIAYNNGHGGFDEGEAVAGIDEMGDIDEEHSNSSTYGWNIYGGAGFATRVIKANAGVSKVDVTQSGTSEMFCTVMDINGDGLADIVQTGKTYYLKNKGGGRDGRVRFEKEYFARLPDAASFGVEKTAEQKQKEAEKKSEYNKTYYIQTPFRIWRAPYSGSVKVHHELRAKTGVKAYLATSGETDKKEIENDAVFEAVEKAEFYFIHDADGAHTAVDKDTRGKDIAWDVTITYETVKPFLVTHTPVFCPLQKLKEQSSHLLSAKEVLESSTYGYAEAFESIYTEEHSEVTEKGHTTYTTTLTLKDDWQESCSKEIIEAVCKKLIEKKHFIPAVLNEAEFRNVVDYIARKTEGKDQKKHKVEGFVQFYEYEAAQGLYYLKEYAGANAGDKKLYDEKRRAALFDIFSSSDLHLENVLRRYDVYDAIETVFCGTKVYYRGREQTEATEARNEYRTGSVLKKGTEIPLGIFDGKAITLVRANGVSKITSRDGTCTWDAAEAESSNTKTVRMSANGAEIEFVLSGYNRRTEKVLASEMDAIKAKLDFTVPGTDVSSTGWQRDFNSKAAFEKWMRQFTKAGSTPYFSDAALQAIADCLYTAEWKLKEKQDQNIHKAQAYLDEYSTYCFIEQRFPFYRAESDGTFSLKEEWKKVKTEADFEKNIGSKPVLDEAAWSRYKEKNELLESMQEEEKIGRYSSITRKVVYRADHAYKVQHGSGEATIQTVMLDGNDFVIRTQHFASVGAYGSDIRHEATWNSKKDFSCETQTDARIVYDEGIQGESEHKNAVYVNVREHMYGGSNGWYYGIWKGDVGDFSAKALSGNAIVSSGTLSEDDFDTDKKSDEYKEQAGNASGNTVPEIRYYFPTKNSMSRIDDGEEADDTTEAIDTEAQTEVSLKSYAESGKAVLIGTVARVAESKKGWDENGNRISVSETKTYAPYMLENTIHVDRSGGSTYYELPEIRAEKPATPGLPVLRVNENEGKDVTTGANANVNLTVTKVLKKLDEITEKIEKNGSGELGATRGKNTSKNVTTQDFRDINGDGIPDILLQGKLFYGSKGESGELSFIEANDSFFAGKTIRKNSNTTTTYGGSFSAGGVATANFDPKGNVKSVTPRGCTVGGGGFYATGDSSEERGLTDINGDGLADYFDGGFEISVGDGFIQRDLFSYNTAALSSSKNETFGINVSIGKGDSWQSTHIGCGANAGAGLSYSASAANTTEMLFDINGDGLADIVQKQLKASPTSATTDTLVRYNTGTGFTDWQKIDLPDWNIKDGMAAAYSTVTDGNLQLNFLKGIPIVGEVLPPLDVFNKIFTGITGDGIALNPIGPFLKKYANSLDFSSTLNLGVNGNVSGSGTWSQDIVIGVVYIGTINVTVSVSGGVNGSGSLTGATVRMQDMDGDGLADHVLRIPGVFPESGLYVKRNLMGGADLLKRIVSSTGGEWEIGYELKYGTPDMPHAKYVMSSLTTKDGCTTLAHRSQAVTVRYRYGEGYYNRTEKDFYGYDTVRTIYADESYEVTRYANRAYYSKGVAVRNEVHSGTGSDIVLRDTVHTLCEEPVALINRTETTTREAGCSGIQTSGITYEYDEYGNVTQVSQHAGGSIYVRADITYARFGGEKYLHAHPTSIEVRGGDGALLRKREGDYDSTTGSLASLRQYYDSSHYAEHRFTYDAYGNTILVYEPGGSMKWYRYDDTVHQYPTTLAKTGSMQRVRSGARNPLETTYVSSIEWDIATGVKKREKDINGNVMSYVYDAQQRLTEVRSPYDTGGVPAVRYSYHTPAGGLWYAVTENKVVTDAHDTEVIKTFIQADGLGRAIISAKTGCTFDTERKVKTVGWNVGGAVSYDAKGRTIAEGQPYFVAGESIEAVNLNGDVDIAAVYKLLRPTEKSYDALDRTVETVLPGVNEKGNKRVQKVRYGITDEGLSYTETTDPEGNVGVQYADARGNIVKVERYSEKDTAHPLTSATYEYDAIGQMTSAYDAARNPITVTYDMLGRKTELTTKDGGAKRYTYDELHLLYEDDAVMRQSGSRVDYSYDGFNRVVKIEYPKGGDVEYEYGAYEAANNSAGKVVSVRDEAGVTRYEYGKLGEVTKETRTLTRHIPAYEDEKSAVMEYVSDYLGRMQTIVYPDREVVTYGYDAGGQVCSIKGDHDGEAYTYVADIGYDEYGQRVYIKYGNGVETNYTYDADMRWLSHIDTANTYGKQYQNIEYSFDDVGNVLGYENNCMNGSRYSTQQTYTYDALYQLIKAEGVTEDNPYGIPGSPDYSSTYTQDFSFDAIGNMTYKKSEETITPAIQKKGGDDLNYEFTYEYDTDYAHRLKRAGNEQKGWRYYTYDANGNVTSESDGVAPNEDTTTLTPVTVTTQTNEAGESVYEADYAWAWPWSGNNNSGKKPVPNNKRRYEWNSRNLLMRSVTPGYDTRYVYSADGNRAAKWTAANSSETLYFNTMWTWHTDTGLRDGQYSKHIYLGETRVVTKQTSKLEASYGQSDEWHHQYYYHPDHLGSAQLITDYEGNEYQRIEYTPYGELWVEKKTEREEGLRYLPYKFTAKEQDEETGLYYYGARYLDAKYSRWLSADPAVGEYIPMAPVNDEARKHNQSLPGMGGVYSIVNLSLYHYAGNNPVKYIDPDGRQSAIPIPIPYPIPWILPKIGPIAIPGEIVVPPILPNPLIQKGGRYYIEQPWDGDWTHAPSGPDMTDPDSNPLGSDWEPDKESNLKDKTGKHKIFRNKKTGESVRWDEPNGNQKGHWHRLNPDKTTNKKLPYLDPKGNPAERNSPDTHIEPNPVLVPITPPITIIDTEVSNGTNT